MATITHQYDVNQVVWLLDSISGISECVILSIDITKDSNTTITYNIKIVKTNGRSSVGESQLYSLLSGVGSALEAYQTLLEA